MALGSLPDWLQPLRAAVHRFETLGNIKTTELTSNPLAQIRRIKIPEFPDGTWHVQWLGNLRTTANALNPVGYEVRVHLSWAGEGTKPPRSIWVPFSNLFYLRTKSRWESRELVELCATEERTFAVPTGQAEILEIRNSFKNYSIKFEDHDLEGFDSPASCYVFHTTENEDLVVPCWEILRAWYLFDHGVMPAVLAGAISDVDRLPTRHQPWREGTGLTQEGKRQYVYPRWLGEDGARRFARLYFDAFANSEARKIFPQLMNKSTPSLDGWVECLMPAVLPPFEGPSRWTVKCKSLKPLHKDGNERWLVLDLQKVDGPLPFSHLDLLPYEDHRQGLNANDPTLPTREVPGNARALVPDGAIELVPVAPDESIEPSDIVGFGFEDNISRDLVIDRPVKLKQVSRVAHLPRDDVETKSGGTDPAGPRSRRTTRTRVTDDEAPFAEDTTLSQTLRAYRLVIGKYPHSRLIRSAESVFIATNTSTRIRRQFAILEASVNGRIGYVLDAQRFGKEEFSFFVCRSPFKGRYQRSDFQSWLNNFPAPQGSPWRVEIGMPRGLLSTQHRLKHQPKDSSAIESRIERLAERIAEAVSSLLGG